MLINTLLKQNYIVKHYELLYSMFRIKEGVIILLLLHLTLLFVGVNSRVHCFCSWILFIAHCSNVFYINKRKQRRVSDSFKKKGFLHEVTSEILEHLGVDCEISQKMIAKSKSSDSKVVDF